MMWSFVAEVVKAFSLTAGVQALAAKRQGELARDNQIRFAA